MAKDLKEFDEDLYLRGDGVASRAITIGRQDTGGEEDTVIVDTLEENFSVEGKRIGVEVVNIAALATLPTTNLTGRIVHVAGQTTAGDGLGGDYYYNAIGKSGVTVDSFKYVAAAGADDYYVRVSPSVLYDISAANIAALPSATTTPQGTSVYVATNLTTYTQIEGVWVSDKMSRVSTDSAWSSMTEVLDDQILYHEGRDAAYIYSTSTSTWSWYSGSKTRVEVVPPTFSVQKDIHALDSRAGREYTRVVNGTVRLADHSRTGTVRQLQPGRCYDFAGVSDRVDLAQAFNPGLGDFTLSAWINTTDTGALKGIICKNPGSGTNRWGLFISYGNLFSLANPTGVAVVASGSVAVDDGTWHHVCVVYDRDSLMTNYVDGVVDGSASIATYSATTLTNASTFYLGRDGQVSTFLDGQAFDFRVYDRALSATEISRIAAMGIGNADIGPTDAVLWYKGDEGGTVTTARNSGSLGSAANGTITAAAISSFHNATVNDLFSFQNEVGYTDDTAGATAAYLPRDEANPSQDVLGNAIQYSGQAPRDPILSSKCLTLNGTNEYVNCGDIMDTDGLDEMSFSAWVKVAANGTYIMVGRRTIATGTPGYIFYLDAGRPRVDVDGDGALSARIDTAIGGTGWRFVEIDCDGSGLASGVTIRLDGVVQAITFSSNLAPTGGASNSDNLLIGAQRVTAPATFLNGSISDVRLTVGSESGHWPLQSGIYGYQDVSGNQNHGTPTISSESTAWANQQNKVDTLVTDGATIATRYSGTGEYYSKAARLTSGALTTLSVAAWVYADALATKNIAGEFETTGNQKGWQLSLDSGGTLRFTLTSDGSTAAIKATTPTLTAKKWTHVAVVYASSGVTFYINGAAVSSTVASGTIPASIHDGTAPFEIGSADGGATPWAGQLSDVVVEATEWSAATVAAIDAGTIPASAWRWRDGDGTEVNNALTDLTENGDPDRIIVPAGIMPVTVGPGVLMPGQSGDLGCGEDNSPLAQQLDTRLGDLTYTSGDGSESPDLFLRERENSEGDDRLQVFSEALTGTELTKVGVDTTV